MFLNGCTYKFNIKNWKTDTSLGFPALKNFTEVATLAASGVFFLDAQASHDLKIVTDGHTETKSCRYNRSNRFPRSLRSLRFPRSTTTTTTTTTTKTTTITTTTTTKTTTTSTTKITTTTTKITITTTSTKTTTTTIRD